MSTARDITAGITALIAFPLAINLPATLADDGSPERGLPLFDRGGDRRPAPRIALPPGWPAQ